MNKFRCSIIDDEDHAIDTLKDYIDEHAKLELIRSFNDPVKALESISPTDKLDIIFLDITMPSISGLDLAKQLKNLCKAIVLTTAHSKYAWEAFDIPVMHYLVKPFNYVTFVTTLKTVIERFVHKEMYRENGVVFVKSPDKVELIKLYIRDIMEIRGAKNYINLITTTDIHSIKMPMWEAEAILMGTQLIRVHRSHFFNVDYLEKIIGNMILTTEKQTIPIGEEYRDFMNKYYRIQTLKPGRDSNSV